MADIGGLSYLLRILDRYDTKVEIKGGCRILMAEYFIITCPFSPVVAFTYGKHTDNPQVDEDIGQLIRRLTQIVELRILNGQVSEIDQTAIFRNGYLDNGGDFVPLSNLGVIGRDAIARLEQ